MRNKHTDSPLSDYVRRWCAQHGITLEKLAEDAGVARGTLYNMLDPKTTPKIPHLLNLANAMGVHHTILFRLKWAEFGVLEEKPCLVSAGPARQQGDASGFIDETVPDGSIIASGSTFEKSWTLQNVGDTVWEGRYLVCIDSDLATGYYPNGQPASDYQLKPHHSAIPIPVTKPGEMVTLAVKFDAPMIAGRYISYWKMVNADGELCFPSGVGASVSILVRSFGVSF